MIGCVSIDEQKGSDSDISAETIQTQSENKVDTNTDISTGNKPNTQASNAQQLNLQDGLLPQQSETLAAAKNAQDYRLLITTTRGMNIPGILAKDVDAAIDKCGTKYQPGTGDVIRSEQDRITRKALVTFMAYYNQQMWAQCQVNRAEP